MHLGDSIERGLTLRRTLYLRRDQLGLACELQALVRRPHTVGEAEPHESARRVLLGLVTRMVPRHVRPGHLACGSSPQMLAENCQLVAKSRRQALDHVRSCD